MKIHIVKLCLLILGLHSIFATLVSAISPYLDASNPSECEIGNKRYWDLIQWFYGSIAVVFVNLIIESKEDAKKAQHHSTFLEGIFEKTNYSVTYRVIDINFEYPSVSYVDTFSWQGVKFEMRPTQPTQIKYRRKRSSLIIDGKALPLRKSELESAALVIVDRISILDQYLTGSPRIPFAFPRQIFIIVITDSSESQFERFSVKVLTKLWQDYGIACAILITPCMGNPELIGSFFPFETVRYNNEMTWGKFEWLPLNNINFRGHKLLKKFENLQAFPLKVSMFPRYPTALKLEELPLVFQNSYFMRVIDQSGGYCGIDGLTLGNMAKTLNFTTQIVTPQGVDFGYKIDNGTFIGSIGDVLYHKTYASFNGRFMLDYGTNDIEYMFPYYFDKLCIVAPKALKIPEWMAIFKCFHLSVWILFLIVNCFCGWFWFLLKRSNIMHLNVDKKAKLREASKTRNRFSMVFIEMWVIMLSGPSTQIPVSTKERFFFAGCLVANLIFAGSFQGSLTTSFSTVSYYKDIDSLAELDDTGLRVGTSSGSMKNIFGLHLFGNDVIHSLAKKFVLLNTTQPIITRTAYARDICCVERLTDIAVIIANQYETPDGGVLLHVIKECPRSYYMAFIVKKGWPLLPAFSNRIRNLFEGGILHLWYDHVEYAIIMHRRFHRQSKSQEAKPFTLVDMQTAFYILSIGLFVCCVVFLCELYVYARRQKNEGKRAIQFNINQSEHK